MAREDIGRVWGCASKDEVDSWQKDPVFKKFFNARPKGRVNKAKNSSKRG